MTSRTRNLVRATLVACVLAAAPVVSSAQTTDSTRPANTYGTTDHRGFDWGWLGLLGLLGLWPKKRKEVVETRTTTGPR